MEENLAQLYDDQFIETCADWAIPYIGDLIGYEPLHALGQARGLARAEVAHTIALRRRKGTAAVLEQLARDVTGWNARAVEYFQLLGDDAVHEPPAAEEPLGARPAALGAAGTARHRLRIRWPIRSMCGASKAGADASTSPMSASSSGASTPIVSSESPALRVDDRRYLFSPLGHPLALYTTSAGRGRDHPSRRADQRAGADRRGGRWTRIWRSTTARAQFGERSEVDNADPSLVLYVDGAEVARTPSSRATSPTTARPGRMCRRTGTYGIDPVLGRIALAADMPVPAAASASPITTASPPTWAAASTTARRPRRCRRHEILLQVPTDHPTIQAALTRARRQTASWRSPTAAATRRRWRSRQRRRTM